MKAFAMETCCLYNFDNSIPLICPSSLKDIALSKESISLVRPKKCSLPLLHFTSLPAAMTCSGASIHRSPATATAMATPPYASPPARTTRVLVPTPAQQAQQNMSSLASKCASPARHVTRHHLAPPGASKHLPTRTMSTDPSSVGAEAGAQATASWLFTPSLRGPVDTPRGDGG